MTPEEHTRESRDSIETAERLYYEGRPLQGAEITWCSVKHAINAIGMQRDWRFSTYGQKLSVIKRLESEGHEGLQQLLAFARRLHTDSDHGYLTPEEIEEYRQASLLLTQRLLQIAEGNNPGDA